MYVYSEDKGQVCSKNGFYAEDLFVESYNKNFGNRPVKTTVKEDSLKHQDFKFLLNNKLVTCDVKYPKKISRDDTTFSSKYIWIEYKTKGFNGWLFGEQDYLAFLMPDLKTFKLVKREELYNICSWLVDIRNHVHDTNNALYKIYHRTNRYGYGDDMLSLIKYSDLDICPSNIIYTIN